MVVKIDKFDEIHTREDRTYLENYLEYSDKLWRETERVEYWNENEKEESEVLAAAAVEFIRNLLEERLDRKFTYDETVSYLDKTTREIFDNDPIAFHIYIRTIEGTLDEPQVFDPLHEFYIFETMEDLVIYIQDMLYKQNGLLFKNFFTE